MSDPLLDAWIVGRPRPQGSMRTFVMNGHAHARHSDSTMSHRAHVIANLAASWSQEPTDAPALVSLLFEFARPKSHYRTGRNSHLLKDTAPIRHTQPPDLDKLVRLMLDGLEMAGVLVNDSQVWHLSAAKMWGTADRTHVTLRA